MPTPSRFFFLPLIGLLACVPPWEPLVGCAEAGACTTGGAASDDGTPTTGVSDGIQTVTGDDESSTSTGSTDIDASTTGEPATPTIINFELSPNPIEFNGPIAVTVTADADAVRMQLDNGDVIELTPGEPGMFHGEILVLTGLINGGDHVALLTPRRGEVEGETVPTPYAVALPKPGSQGFWETGNLIGEGRVVAMVVLPNGQVVELGTLTIDGTSRCYLRRRTKGGAWGDNDVRLLAPEDACEAIDLVVDEDGALFTLVNRQGKDGLRWWLAKIAAWGQDPINVGFGTKGETASALARHGSGAVAVCAYGPTSWGDDDAVVSIFRPDLSGETWTIDYQPDEKTHWFSERTRDCVVTGDTLALVGEAWGKHDNENIQRDRLFVLRFDIKSKTSAWTVAPAGVKTQSSAQAVAADVTGRLIIGGYTCNDACQPEGDLRIFDAGEISWSLPLGIFPTKQFAVQDVAWSPAGYAIVATGGVKGNETAFTVRAYTPDNSEPLWTFARKDSQVLHVAFALALGAYGEVYAGGLGANGYPAVAFIGG